jgi:hypothetical protein
MKTEVPDDPRCKRWTLTAIPEGVAQDSSVRSEMHSPRTPSGSPTSCVKKTKRRWQVASAINCIVEQHQGALLLSLPYSAKSSANTRGGDLSTADLQTSQQRPPTHHSSGSPGLPKMRRYQSHIYGCGRDGKRWISNPTPELPQLVDPRRTALQRWRTQIVDCMKQTTMQCRIAEDAVAKRVTCLYSCGLEEL